MYFVQLKNEAWFSIAKYDYEKENYKKVERSDVKPSAANKNKLATNAETKKEMTPK